MADSLNELVRTWRQRALLTQGQLAERTGLGVRTIRRLESRDLLRPRSDSVRLLADALKLSDAERGLLATLAHGRPAPKPIPQQLPRGLASFTGRAQQLREMDALLVGDSAPTAVVISTLAGTAGVGKTALALHWAHRVAHRFVDGQLYVNLRGFDPSGVPMTPAAAIRGFLSALDIRAEKVPAGLDAQVVLYRSLLAERQVLVILDNARDAEQVRPLLPGARGCLVIVTSRNQLTGLVATDGARRISLDLFDRDEARQLLAHRLGVDRLEGEADAVESIIGGCARLPLALAVMAARAAERPAFPLAGFAAELARLGLSALDCGDHATQVRAVFSWSYGQLTGAVARLFRFLGLHPGPDITGPAAASLAGVPVEQAERMLVELTRAHLVTQHAPGRFGFHDLLRAYAAERTHAQDSADERHRALHRLLDHYVHTAYTAALRLEPGRDPIALARPHPGTSPELLSDREQALAWFQAEREVLLAALREAVASGHDDQVCQLAWTLVDFQDRQGHWHDWIDTQRTALAAAQRLQDHAREAHAHICLGVAYDKVRRHEDAQRHCHSALRVSAKSGDPVLQARAHMAFQQDLASRELYREGLDHAWHALKLFRAAGHQVGEARALNTVGWYHAQLGEYDQALNTCRRALSLNRLAGSSQGEAIAWSALGYVHRQLENFPQALTCYEQAIDQLQVLGNRYNVARALIPLGETHEAAGDRATAWETWQQALLILADLDHPDADKLRAKLHALGSLSPTTASL